MQVHAPMLVRHVFLLFALFVVTGAELISLIAGISVAFGGGAFFAFKDQIKCKIYECCRPDDVRLNYHKMNTDIENLLYGQHLVKDVVVNAIKEHWHNTNPQKPLVMSFHGYTGSGKNFVAEIIANNTFRLGLKSGYVKHIVATNDFPDSTKIEEYKAILRSKIIETSSKCERSLFIFDEIDKMPGTLLESIKPFLDYYSSVSDVDFRRNMFVFLSNKGGSKIADITLKQYTDGYPREQLTLNSFERHLSAYSFNENGGLQMSELISNHLIDHFVPFLPLQREHVKKCVEAYIRKRGRADVLKDSEVVERILNALQYFPETSKAFSSSGCKRVDAKTDLELARIRPPINQYHRSHDDDDEEL